MEEGYVISLPRDQNCLTERKRNGFHIRTLRESEVQMLPAAVTGSKQ